MTDTRVDIADVAAASGLAPSALRFYERRGLIEPTGRNGLRRVYSADVLTRLSFIACARSSGFTIAEIARFLTARPSDDQLRVRMAAKAHQVDQEIVRLTQMRDSLAHAAVCAHDPIVECPDFKQAFEPGAAAQG